MGGSDDDDDDCSKLTRKYISTRKEEAGGEIWSSKSSAAKIRQKREIPGHTAQCKSSRNTNTSKSSSEILHRQTQTHIIRVQINFMVNHKY